MRALRFLFTLMSLLLVFPSSVLAAGNQTLVSPSAKNADVPWLDPQHPEGGGVINQFDFSLYTNCFGSQNVEPGAKVTARVLRGSATLAMASGVVNKSGLVKICFGGTDNEVIRPGHHLVIKIYLPGSTNPDYSYKSHIPHLNILRVKKDTATLYGDASSGKLIEAIVIHHRLNQGSDLHYIQRSTYVSGAGKWELAFNDNLAPDEADVVAEGGGYGIRSFRGGESFTLKLYQTPNLRFSRVGTVPTVSCTLGQSLCYYRGLPGQPVSLTLKQAGETFVFKGRTNNYTGDKFFKLVNSVGTPLILAAGNEVQATAAAAHRLAFITSVLNKEQDVVTGTAPANRWLTVSVRDLASDYFSGYCWTSTNASKQYTCDLIGLPDMLPDHHYETTVQFINPVTGNETIYIVSEGQ